MNQWDDKEIVKQYAEMVKNPDLGWYEDIVNSPQIMGMIPVESQRVLDFGSGPGNIKAALADAFPIVEGCDVSKTMVDTATKNEPRVKFFVWDGKEKLDKQYDAIFSKMTLHFVDDLDVLAQRFSEILTNRGVAVISVPHPSRTKLRKGMNYWQKVPYKDEIGASGIYLTMIHRSTQQYLEPFFKRGFVMDDLYEPEISDEMLAAHSMPKKYGGLPLRLNLRLVKVAQSG